MGYSFHSNFIYWIIYLYIYDFVGFSPPYRSPVQLDKEEKKHKRDSWGEDKVFGSGYNQAW